MNNYYIYEWPSKSWNRISNIITFYEQTLDIGETQLELVIPASSLYI